MLRTYRLGEADRIVVLLTEHHGKVRAVAKGVRKTKSKFGAPARADEPRPPAARTRARELDIVSQAESVESLAPLVGDLDHLTQRRWPCSRPSTRWRSTASPRPHLYRMLVGVLRTIGPSAPVRCVVPAFYWKLLAAEGVRPELDACVRCGEPGPLVAFDLDEGGVLCRTCRSGTAISPEALDLMRLVLGGRLNDALAARPRPRPPTRCRRWPRRPLEHHIERRLRTVAMFERLLTQISLRREPGSSYG